MTTETQVRRDHGKEIFMHTNDFAQEAVSKGPKKLKELADNVDQRVHKEP